MNNLLLLVIAMALVTYLPRLLPFLVIKEKKLPPFWNSFLKYIPVAVIGALIFPGILTSTGQFASALFGGLIAFLLAWRQSNVIVVVFGAIVGVFLWEIL
ncbi:AzlD domain-containing protein [Heliorestis convoluta]|uniref:Branched-chain amino acid transport protein n=1 Tax=Heliorestis convoluta TaxID=356322 RepID=A0A5Q2N216_9FIRM|nr:AzlD domain-containing protein [Heliorestis convoluta]QGG49424.1 branched-chain amino acid transport protein [Heliorestis convoluta]